MVGSPCRRRDAKAMARSLRDALTAKAVETSHSESLELIAKAFGYKNWNILSAKIEAAEPKPSDERWFSTSGTRDRRGKRADPSQITRDYIAQPARLAMKDIGYEQRGFNWEKASIKVYLHGQSVDIAQGAAPTYTHHIPKVMSEVWHANPNGKFVIGELRHRWRGQLELRHCVRGELLAISWPPDGAIAKSLEVGLASVCRALEGA
jgi:Glyoxalase superfamily protein